MKAVLTSAEVAALLRVSPATVKRWADAGLLPHLRTSGGHRRFSRVAIENVVARGSLDVPALVADWVDRLVARGEGLSVDAELLADRSRREGWFAVAESFGPVLDELGRRWEGGTLGILDEHVASARLERALSRVAATLPLRAGAPRAILATPEGEAHTLGLSLAELCMREWGWSTVWSGRDTPVADLERAATGSSAAALVLSASVRADAHNLAEVAVRLASASRSSRVRLVLGGRGAWPDPPPSGAVVRTFAALRGWMARFDRGRV